MRRPRRCPPRSVSIRGGRSCSPRGRRQDASPLTGSTRRPASWPRWVSTRSGGGPRRFSRFLSAADSCGRGLSCRVARPGRSGDTNAEDAGTRADAGSMTATKALVRVGIDARLGPCAPEVLYTLRTLCELAGYAREFVWLDAAAEVTDSAAGTAGAVGPRLDLYYGLAP